MRVVSLRNPLQGVVYSIVLSGSSVAGDDIESTEPLRKQGRFRYEIEGWFEIKRSMPEVVRNLL